MYFLCYFSEKKFNKKFTDFKITQNKFFAPAKEPSMLTYNERLSIQYLHKKDPIVWNIQALSESYPATPIIIKKIIKSRIKITPERQKKMDANVEKNWKLLEENKLEASPRYLEHLKKFVNRRETLLENIKNSQFYLPKVEVKKQYTGETSKILYDYAKEIDRLTKEFNSTQDEEVVLEKSKLLPENKYVDMNSSNEQHDKLTSKKMYDKTEDSKTDKMLKKIINDESSEGIHDRSDGSSLIDFISKKNFSREHLFVNNFNRDNDNLDDLKPSKVNFNKLSKFKNRSNFKLDWDSEEYEDDEFDNMSGNLSNFHKKQETKSSTIYIKEENLGKNLSDYENDGRSELSGRKEKEILKYEKRIEKDSNFKENDEKYYDKIAQDMNNSIFWNAKKDSREKAQVELEKKPLLQPDKFTNKINEQNVDNNNNNNSNVNITTSWSYPEKIKVPSANRGTNVIYKVKDCYYDSNGDFLYRVPGMIN